jgi:hypothetical protein
MRGEISLFFFNAKVRKGSAKVRKDSLKALRTSALPSAPSALKKYSQLFINKFIQSFPNS